MHADDPDTTYVRRNIWELDAETPWDPITLAYANAIKVLQARPLTDPTSWEYLSAVHGRRGPALPGAAWNQCEHGNWYFLPWHRMYLYYFERIIRAEVIDQGGPEDWALPFWDYSRPGQAALPPAFRRPTMPDGSDNPLLVAARAPGINDGGELDERITSADAALEEITFTAQPPITSFGGGDNDPVQFFNAGGQLEFTPHNAVHGVVGGWMGNANTAALDPIFWLHHCNIDRLWEVWLAGGGGRAHPDAPEWREQTFVFHDEHGTRQDRPVSDYLDITQLGYAYEGVVAAAVAGETLVTLAVAGKALTATGRGGDAAMSDPEMVGASERPVVLTGAPASVEVAIDRRAVEGRARALGGAAGPQHVYLSLEDIEAERNPEVAYAVYLAAGPTSTQAPRYIGNVSFFGIEHLSRTDLDHDGPHGLRRNFDITSCVDEIRAEGTWAEERVVVSFEAIGLRPAPGTADATVGAAGGSEERRADSEPPVTIGRVSIFHG